ncbi:non-ribosomal peptide synthetase [Bacillus atrophaeus]|uniref:non-ribosomal peptide synthetase n=1 Tax=Bacillus atrophaeus TaxID=1452 RepID=UPI0022822822|nr:non-ribosomal peptide synthetase [Bacillus atrophaeus]MCY8823359.1 amino acid adenylation domain-containing protein [Bacillus atrophaeus]
MRESSFILQSSEMMKKAKKYWMEELNKGANKETLYTDFPVSGSNETKKYRFEVNEDVFAKLQKLGNEDLLAMYTILLANLQACLSRYSIKKELMIGVPVLYKLDSPQASGNTNKVLPLFTQVEESMSFKELLIQTRQTLINHYSNQIYPLDDIFSEDIIREWNTIQMMMLNLHDSSIYHDLCAFPNNKISFVAEVERNALEIEMVYNAVLYQEDTIIRIANSFKRTLQQVLSNPNMLLDDLKLLDKREEQKLLKQFCGRKSEVQKDKTIIQLFEDKASQHPEQVAVVCNNQSLTYQELNGKANALAKMLLAKGVGTNSIVGLYMERSLDCIVGILGILKAGGAYMPFDLEYPDDRIDYMIRDSKTQLVLTQSDFRHRISAMVECLTVECAQLDSKESNPERVTSPEHLLYVIYTSGTTGNPKGVMFTNRGLVNLITYQRTELSLNLDKKVLQFASVAFDVGSQEIWSTLLSGGELYLIDKDARKNPSNLLSFLEEKGIETVFLPTSFLKLLVSENEYLNRLARCVKDIIVAGEQLTVELRVIRLLAIHGVQLHNHYGPTETHVVTTHTVSEQSGTIPPIGKPINNVNVYIIDKKNQLVPLGGTGELCISGNCLAKGYLNNLELTDKNFVDNPFESGSKMYRTGDLARWMPDGNIHYLERADRQVKIRGFRIELAEIESQLLKIEGIKTPVVLAKEIDGVKVLYAYYVSQIDYTVSELRELLLTNLPEYMIPSFYIKLEKIPLTTNGKIDLKALSLLLIGIQSENTYVAPRNKIEKKLTEIWSDVLGINKVGIHDDFFELGGHSLKAMTIVTRISQQLHVEVHLKEIFAYKTIEELSKYIEKQETLPAMSIEKVREQEYYEASSAQKRMYLLQQFENNGVSYHVPGTIKMVGRLSFEKLQASLLQLIERHEALRTVFTTIDGKVVQKIKPMKDIKFSVELLNVVNQGEANQLMTEFIRPFDLQNEIPIRAVLIKQEEEVHYLVLDLHHIVADGVTIDILLHEWRAIYSDRELTPTPFQYKDYSAWQLKLQDSKEMKAHENYWLTEMAGELPVLQLPTDFPRPIEKDYQGDRVHLTLNEAVTKRLKEIAKETGSTLYMVLLAELKVLLSLYSNQDDIIVGSPIAGRKHHNLESMVGVFINTLAIRSSVKGDLSFREYLEDVKEKVLSAFDHQDYPFQMLVEKLDVERSMNRNPLFDVMFTLREKKVSDWNANGIDFKLYEMPYQIEKFDLSWDILEDDGELQLTISYAVNLFKRETVERMAEHFAKISEAISKSPELTLNRIEFVSEQEKQRLLYEFNPVPTEYPRDKTIHELIELQVAKKPDNIAIIYEGETWTYQQLNEKANRLARMLQKNHVKPETVVAILLEKSFDLLVGVLGILKAGGTYLPIDPQYPPERVQYLLEDSGASILLMHDQTADLISGINSGQIINLDDSAAYDLGTSNLNSVSGPNNLAYIIYTSGSTGKPKGVAIEHRSLVNFSFYHNQEWDVDETDIAGMYSSVGFDGNVWDIFPHLIAGACLHIIPEEIRFDPEKLNFYYEKNGITIGFLTTSMFEQFVKYENKSLKRLLAGGDKLKVAPTRSYELYNNYGPTECTVITTSFKVDRYYDNYPIGKPVNNAKVYIISRSNQLMPIGVPGELCIGGDGVARGYFKKEELTKEKFIDNPFEPGQKIFRTGDMARWLPDGNLEFIGRIDYQVKIRGFRVELLDIENQLLRVEGILDAAVLDKMKDGDKIICAYYVADKEFSIIEMRTELEKHLPEYMIPSYFIKVDHIPMTVNAKIDRKALPEPTGDIQTGRLYVAPRNVLEKKLVSIWSEVLGVNKVSMNDEFFELGGHSLKAVALTERIYEQMEIKVPLKELFSAGTVEKLSKYIASKHTKRFDGIEKVVEQEWYEASSAQKRMYLVHKLDQGSIAYNVPWAMEIVGELNLKQLKSTLFRLIERHEALRTIFSTDGDLVIQKVLPMEQVHFKVSMFIAESNQEARIIATNFIRPFNLESEMAFRVGVIRIEETKHILVLDLHHIITDGVSMSILMSDFNHLYSEHELAPLKIQYKDYSAWQLKQIDSEEMKQHEAYWLEEFAGELPIIQLPTDWPRPKQKNFVGKHVYLTLDDDIVSRLKQVAKDNKSTLYMVLLAGVNILLSKYSGQEDMVVGSPIAGRNHSHLEGIVGMFVNTLVIRSSVNKNITFKQYLETLREKTISAFEHQVYPFEELVEKLDVPRTLDRNPLFDVMFALQNENMAEMKVEGLRFRPVKPEHNIEKFDLSFNAAEQQGKLVFDISYAVSLFNHDTIERMSQHFIKILNIISKNPKIQIKDLEIITEAEKQELLQGYNNTVCEYPIDKTIHQWFEAQVEKTPDNVAVTLGDERFTYKELNRKANALAKMLAENGAQRGDNIGIKLSRSIELVIGILAILKTGAAYIPIEPSNPADRIKYILQNSQSTMLLTDVWDEQLYSPDLKILQIREDVWMNESDENLNVECEPSDIAYIIYTSGSTGVPKGVVITHLSCLNTCFDINAKFGVTEKDAIISTASIGFDLSVYDLFGAFITGAKVALVKDTKDINEISSVLMNENISFWNSAPPFMEMVVDSLSQDYQCTTLRIVLLSGDWISLKLPPKINQYFPQAKLISAGGATEGSIWSIYFPVEEIKPKWKSIPYGFPLGNQQIYILDEQLHMQPIGIVGEICIGGIGVAVGYANNPRHTEKSFVEHPKFGKIYKTGDLGVMKNEGYIEFLGRKDHQVKIRGFRVELGEIEGHLRNIDKIEECIVLDKELAGVKVLCAYYTAETELPSAGLIKELLARLPQYMVPSYFIKMEQMPITTNGKLDRKAFPMPSGDIKTGSDYTTPQNQLQQQLADIWSDVLGVSQVGIHDDFFELGGHSLKANTLVIKISQLLGVEVPLKELFAAGNIDKLSDYIASKEVQHFVAIEKIEEKAYYQASSAQRRMYLLQQMDKYTTAYNVPGVLEIQGELDIDHLLETLIRLIERHEVLRTLFADEDGTVVQKIIPMKNIHFEVDQYWAIDEAEINNLMTSFIRPFDLQTETPFRAGVIWLEENKQLLMFDFHHIITDGISISIMIKEFGSLFAGQELEPLVLQYKDYAAWQVKQRESFVMKTHESYWLSEMKGVLPELDLPTDYPRPEKKDYRGNHERITLNAETTAGLKKIAIDLGSTLYMVLLSGVNILLSRYSGQEDIIVGSPIAGRNHRDVESMMGLFVNTLAIRTMVDSEMTFKQYLETVKQKVLNAFEHQEYQFEVLVEKLVINHNAKRNPLFNVMFILQNIDSWEISVEGLTIKQRQQKVTQEKLDITFTAEEKGDEIDIDINYAVSLFHHETIVRMSAHLMEIINQIIEDPNIKIADIQLKHDKMSIKTINFEEEFNF